MGPTPISTAYLLTSLLAVTVLEAAAAIAATHLQLPRIGLIGAVRTTQTVTVMVLAIVHTGGLQVLGLDRDVILPGVKQGLVWSAGFAAATGLLFLGLFMAGHDPFKMIRMPLPTAVSQRILFFFVGGIVGPIFEELAFRGVIFGYIRRWNVPAAVLISSVLFAAFHLPAIPVTQFVGGVVFAIAYYTSKSLMAPIIVHVLGNIAIFTLSLPLS